MLELAILFLAAFAAAAISGAAGFGGALLLLPLLTIAQLIGNLSRTGFGFRHIRRRSVGRFLLGAAPFSFPGAQSFVSLPGALMTRVIGAAILAFVALRACGVLKLKASRARLVLGGAVVGFLLGLAGRAGPLGSAVFLSLGLPPVAYIASEAATALAMHAVKTLVYQRYVVLDRRFWGLAAAHRDGDGAGYVGGPAGH